VEALIHWIRKSGRRCASTASRQGCRRQKLVRLLGVTFQQVQKYEKGTNRVSSGRLARLAQLFKQPITAFYPNGAP
jgi:transcriptional regulator with XRE-family HTH domain